MSGSFWIISGSIPFFCFTKNRKADLKNRNTLEWIIAPRYLVPSQWCLAQPFVSQRTAKQIYKNRKTYYGQSLRGTQCLLSGA